MDAERFDVIVVGGGPNGLTSAAYLQRAGAKVVVLDKRFEWGGSMTTDDFSTPFYFNLCQLALPLGGELPPCTDLDLTGREALTFLSPDPVAAFVPADGGDPLIVRRGGEGLGTRLPAMLDEVDRVVRPMLYTAPSDLGRVEATVERGGATQALELGHMSPGQLVGQVDDDRARALLRYLCATLGFVDADEPLGLIGAFCLARALQPTLAVGGAGALSRAVFRAGARAGVQYRATADVWRLEAGTDGVRAVCRDGREFVGRALVCALDPKTVFLELLDGDAVPDALRHAATDWRLDAVGSFVAHFGIKGQPPQVPTDESAGKAFMVVLGFADDAAVARHVEAAAFGRLPDVPAGHLTVTSLLDRSQAAPGPYGPLHTLRFETVTTPVHPDGAWNRRNTAEYRSRCLDLIKAHTSGLDQARVLFSFSDSPLDLERRFRTTRNGSVRQGHIAPDQTFANRPHIECSSGWTPIPGLYLAGGAVHPGVPGSLAGGYNAAAAVCSDVPDLVRWWAEAPMLEQARSAGMLPEPVTVHH